jgi:hypothetical protein
MELPHEIFGQPSNAKRAYLQHAVIVHFIYYKDELDPLYELERKLEQVINEQGVGLYDGHEIAVDDSDGFLYMYGPSAENLFRAIKPTLEETDFTRGAVANLRFGAGPEAMEIDIEIEK